MYETNDYPENGIMKEDRQYTAGTEDIRKHKYKWQNIGYYVFVARLVAMAVTYIIDSPLDYIPEEIDTSKIIVDGKLNLTSSQFTRESLHWDKKSCSLVLKWPTLHVEKGNNPW